LKLNFKNKNPWVPTQWPKLLVISPSIKVTVVISPPYGVKTNSNMTGKLSVMAKLSMKVHLSLLLCKPLTEEILPVLECNPSPPNPSKSLLKKKNPVIVKPITPPKLLPSSL